MTDKNSPATKKDLSDLEGRFDVKINGLDSKITGLDAKIEGLDGKLNGMHGEINGMHGEINGLDGKLNGMRGEITGMRGEITGLDSKINGLNAKIDGVPTKLRDDIAEMVRDAQTEILRGFVAFQNSNMPRMRKMEADLSNVNASTSQRLEVLEERVLEIEKKLIIGNR